MKKLSIICLALLLCGCIPPQIEIAHPDVAVYGDSLCAGSVGGGMTYPRLTGIRSDCVPSRPLTALSDDLPEYRVIFLALITNDLGRTSLDDYRASLQRKLISTNATVYCVLSARLSDTRQDAYNQIMMEECANTINPKEYGVLPRADDGIHWTAEDHRNFAQAITERI